MPWYIYKSPPTFTNIYKSPLTLFYKSPTHTLVYH